MQTVKRLLYREILISIAYVCAGFLSLIFFFDLVDELASVGQQNYKLWHALAYVSLQIPGHLYELLPITVLIGAVLALARFAQSSEFTVLRTGGLTPRLALKTLLVLGLWLVGLTVVVGDYVAPNASKYGQLLRARQTGNITIGQTGAWLKEKQTFHRYAVNVGALSGEGQMLGVRIFEFNNDNHFVSLLQSERAFFEDGAWVLRTAKHTEFPLDLTLTPPKPFGSIRDANEIKRLLAQHDLKVTEHAEFRWATELTTAMVSVALLKPERMSTWDLFTYTRHLDNNGQNAQLFEIEFWRKVVYPLSALVMLTLALPFAYLHFRSGAIAGSVFVGVLVGISFFLLNAVFGFVGTISAWPPLLAASTPSLLYLALALGAFGWVVYRR